jgi:replicative DNA helicase
MNLDRIPYAKDAEEYILSGILVDKEHLSSLPYLKPVWFSEKGSKIITAANELYVDGKDVTLLTLVKKLQGEVSHMDLATLSAKYTAAEDFKKCARYLETQYNGALLNAKLAELSVLDAPPEVKIAQLTELISLTGFTEDKDPRSSNKIANEYIDKVSTAHEKGETMTGLTTGFRALDEVIGGYNASDLMIVAGRPGMGKTALALSLSNEAAKAGHRVLFISLEMSSEQLIKRWLSLETGLNAGILNRGKYESDHVKTLVEYSQGRREHIYIDDEASITLGELVAKVRRHQAKNGLDVLFVDYIQLIKSQVIKGRTREQEVAEISRTLKLLAKDLSITVVALAQLSRGVEGRQDKRPMLSDLRESGAIEQDADIIIFPYRPMYYNREDFNPNNPEEAELVIGKNRHGEAPIVDCVFTPWLAKYSQY